jgi:hypothetical protein
MRGAKKMLDQMVEKYEDLILNKIFKGEVDELK